MKTLKSISTAVCLTLAASSASWAEGLNYEMPSIYFDGLNAKLIHAGYSGVRVVNVETRYLVAIDKDGSEVMLFAHPSQHKIARLIYVHPSDN